MPVPAALVAVMVRVWSPTDRLVPLHEPVLQLAGAAPSRLHMTTAVASLTVKVTVASVALLVATGPWVIVTVGDCAGGRRGDWRRG